jgi:hypothetical protein
MFIRYKGKTKIVYYPMTASVAVLAGTVMALSGGKLIIATSTTEGADIVGVLVGTIASTDADYATDLRPVAVEVPVEKDVEWTFIADSTLAITDIGLYLDISTANGTTTTTHVVHGANTYGIVKVTGFISTTKGRGVLNTGFEFLT